MRPCPLGGAAIERSNSVVGGTHANQGEAAAQLVVPARQRRRDAVVDPPAGLVEETLGERQLRSGEGHDTGQLTIEHRCGEEPSHLQVFPGAGRPGRHQFAAAGEEVTERCRDRQAAAEEDHLGPLPRCLHAPLAEFQPPGDRRHDEPARLVEAAVSQPHAARRRGSATATARR